MGWGKTWITRVALRSAPEDYAAFEAIGLTEREGMRVLDVGCFDGFNTVLKFAPYASIERVVGIDPSTSDIAVARERTDDPRFSFIESDFAAYEPQGGEGSFDLVYFSHVLQHLADPQAALDKARRLLAPGGFVIVKTTDDAAKLSYPDPDRVLKRLLDRYERFVLPNTPHTRVTDRYNGEKCYSYMKRAGLGNVRVHSFVTDTAQASLDERRALFERCVYFRRNVPACVDAAIAEEIHELVAALGELFEREDYYFSTASFVIIGQNLDDGAEPCVYAGPVFGEAEMRLGETDKGEVSPVGPACIRALGESDLGDVMAIEIAAFDAPWTPLAFAMDLRHNPCARYAVAERRGGAAGEGVAGSAVPMSNGAMTGTVGAPREHEEGSIAGYIGWWMTPEGASIVRVAVDSAARREGIGRALVEYACARAAAEGASSMRLEVREGNERARAFYRALGFAEGGRLVSYYDNPSEDAVVMERSLGDTGHRGDGSFLSPAEQSRIKGQNVYPAKSGRSS